MGRRGVLPPQHWYRQYVGACPMCMSDRSYRVRVYGERPEDPRECCVVLSDREAYDYCMEETA